MKFRVNFFTSFHCFAVHSSTIARERSTIDGAAPGRRGVTERRATISTSASSHFTTSRRRKLKSRRTIVERRNTILKWFSFHSKSTLHSRKHSMNHRMKYGVSRAMEPPHRFSRSSILRQLARATETPWMGLSPDDSLLGSPRSPRWVAPSRFHKVSRE